MKRHACLLLAAIGSVNVADVRAEPAWNLYSIGVAWTQNVGFGTSVFVAGSADSLGAWTPTGAVKLRWTPGNVWTGRVAIPAGATTEYKFIWRSTATNRICDPSNVTWMPDVSPTQQNLGAYAPPVPPPPYAGKTIYYLSGLTNVAVVYRIAGTNWGGAPMEPIGPGRAPAEYLYRATGIGSAGAPLEFVLNGYLNGTQYWDNAPVPNPINGLPNYYTLLDSFVLQDGQIYDYFPPPSPSAPFLFITNVSSTVSGIPSRTIRIRLPRGYVQNTWKRYPVLYMHDGQNIFDPGGPFGSWSANTASDREISQGRMREVIIVGIDNADRRVEYIPDGDRYNATTAMGRASAYLQFVVQNVKPTLDYHFRTLPDWRNTGVMGSSLGGIISIYFGFETNVFGIVGAMSPGFGRATNYAAAFPSKPKRPLRVYIDTGTNEGLVGQPPDTSYWEPVLAGYDGLLAQGYTPGIDLMWSAGCGHVHNEAAWSNRLPGAFRFLFPPTDEPNRLQHLAHPPSFRSVESIGSTALIRHDAIARHAYILESSAAPDGPWDAISTTAPFSAAWSYPLATSWLAAPQGFYRLRVEARP
ncbi:MAG: alpha/beta hydrolase-fold protein [Kiritimatiellae bacterium]|nr:alpha/beta hydrolase-fold protein [Kiritimatiellia bacterium]MDW8459520.1 alpha/beta hydrolase-fold protein [Verrucomicrobiota bacterium]